MASGNSIERYALVLLGGIALLTFFFPLISFQIPIVGAKTYSGYDLILQTDDLSNRMTSAKSVSDAPEPKAKPADESNKSASQHQPLSLRLFWAIPFEITFALICAALLIVSSLFRIRLARIPALAGMVGGLLAILHVTIANSDMKRFFEVSMAQSAAALEDNPFSSLANSLSSLMVNAFQLKPGTGLWVLTLALALGALLAFSGVLSRFQIVDRSSQ